MPTKRQRQTTGSVQPPATPSKSPAGEVMFYRSPDGIVRLKVQLTQDTVWLTQQQMASLFQRERSVITKYIRNVFKEGELPEESNVQNLHILPQMGKPIKLTIITST
ncbi:hypothetical protein [Nitrospira sp. Ecomares 2.1]